MLRALPLASLLLLAGERSAGATLLAQTCSEGIFLVSAGVVTASAIYDIASAPASARRYNRAHLSIAPLLDPRRGSYGFSASWSFGRASKVAPRSRPVAVPATKSPTTAFVLSFASTAVPVAVGAVVGNAGTDAGWYVFLGGIVIGPSVGHFYVGETGRGLATTAIRGAGTVVGLYALAPCFGD